jgi:hypothetical protein
MANYDKIKNIYIYLEDFYSKSHGMDIFIFEKCNDIYNFYYKFI